MDVWLKNVVYACGWIILVCEWKIVYKRTYIYHPYTNCIPLAYHIPIVYQLYTNCIPIVYQLYTNCIPPYTVVYHCIPLYTIVYRCIPLYTVVYHCILLSTKLNAFTNIHVQTYTLISCQIPTFLKCYGKNIGQRKSCRNMTVWKDSWTFPRFQRKTKRPNL